MPVAIIIDDLGYELDAGRRAIALPGPLTYAVLPGTPRGRPMPPLAIIRRMAGAIPTMLTASIRRTP